jgi:hypothetical protein
MGDTQALDDLLRRITRLEKILLPLHAAEDTGVPGNRNPYSDPVLRANWNRFIYELTQERLKNGS